MNRKELLEWLDVVVDVLAKLGAGEQDARAPLPNRTDAYGAVFFGLNALAEELEAKQAAVDELHAKLVRREKLAVIGELSATVSHELRNPLGTIRSSSVSVRQQLGDSLTPALAKTLTRIERNVDRCVTITDDLLDLSRRPVLSLKPVPVGPWLGELVANNTFGPASVALGEATDETADIDAERLRRCLVNLVRNAHEADASQIILSARATPSSLEIAVTDDGSGIEDADRDDLFTPFYTTKPFGVGLGLSISRELIEDHGGHLTLDSEPGKGTVATISLPPSLTETGPTTRALD